MKLKGKIDGQRLAKENAASGPWKIAAQTRGYGKDNRREISARRISQSQLFEILDKTG